MTGGSRHIIVAASGHQRLFQACFQHQHRGKTYTTSAMPPAVRRWSAACQQIAKNVVIGERHLVGGRLCCNHSI